MKKYFKDLKKYAMDKSVAVNTRKNKSNFKKTNHISKRFGGDNDLKQRKIRNYCHYKGNIERGSTESVCNVKYKMFRGIKLP